MKRNYGFIREISTICPFTIESPVLLKEGDFRSNAASGSLYLSIRLAIYLIMSLCLSVQRGAMRQGSEKKVLGISVRALALPSSTWILTRTCVCACAYVIVCLYLYAWTCTLVPVLVLVLVRLRAIVSVCMHKLSLCLYVWIWGGKERDKIEDNH